MTVQVGLERAGTITEPFSFPRCFAKLGAATISSDSSQQCSLTHRGYRERPGPRTGPQWRTQETRSLLQEGYTTLHFHKGIENALTKHEIYSKRL